MEVLVMTNGVLMLVPGRCCSESHECAETYKASQFSSPLLSMLILSTSNRGGGGGGGGPPSFLSHVHLLVFIVLPLGTLVAQRIANPNGVWYGSRCQLRHKRQQQESIS